MNRLVRKDIPHKVYKHSILVRASVTLEYEDIRDVDQEDLDKFLGEHFGLGEKSKEDFLGKGITIRAVDGDVEVRLRPSSFQVIIGGANYVSFKDSLQELAGAGSAFLTEVGKLKAVKSAEIRKIDALKVRDDEAGKKIPLKDLIESFFSETLLEEGPLKTDQIDDSNVGLLKEFSPQSEEEYVALKIRYGYQNDDDSEWNMSMVFDSYAKYEKPFSVTDVDAIYDKLNKQLFGLFQGCISERVIKMLEE